MIEFRNVTKKFGALTALSEVSFLAEGKKTVGLLGCNGAGKTTALNLMTGYFPPDAGEVFIGGCSMAKEGRECRRKIGYLPEHAPLYGEMTVREYLNFVCDLREVSPRGKKAHVEEIISLCGLAEVSERLLGHLSKGYGQRAGIAQALCGAPEILILDEPTVGLDPVQSAGICNLIRNLGTERTVIFSSHLLGEVQQMCQEVLILHEGRLIRQMSLGVDTGNLEKVFLATVAGNGAEGGIGR